MDFKEVLREHIILEAEAATSDVVAPAMKQHAMVGYLSRWIVDLQEELAHERTRNRAHHTQGPPTRVSVQRGALVHDSPWRDIGRKGPVINIEDDTPPF